MIKLVLMWHKLHYYILFVIFWKICYVRSQVFCLWLQWMTVFFYFSITTKHPDWQRLSQRDHKNRHFKHVYFYVYVCFCVLSPCFLKQLFWNRPFKNSSSIVTRYNQTHKSLWLSVTPSTYNTAKYFFYFLYAAFKVVIFLSL